jgi:phage tail-like protein
MTARLPPAALAWRVPPVPAPPHDPGSLLLAGFIGPQARGGWRAADGAGGLYKVEIAAGTQALVLEPTPDATRRLTEPSGSFGGLRMPLNAALGPAGDVYLLDPQSGELKRFDPCACRFEAVPCFLRLATPPQACAIGPGPRRVPLDLLGEPHGIAICGGDLYIADSGHARVLRYAMNGFLARGALQLPRAEAEKRTTKRWNPFALAFDGRGCLYVSDPDNQRIDIFDAQGRWRGAHATDAPAWALALDCKNRLYALVAPAGRIELGSKNDGYGARWTWAAGGESASAVVLSGQESFERAQAPARQTRDFAAPPMAIDARGHLHLICAEGDVAFDARGLRVRPEARVLEERYLRSGTYRSGALDSEIEGCQWHRIELRGALPEGCRVRVRTLCAQVELGEADLAALTDEAWNEGATASAMDRNGRWDCLVKSPPGRFLWMRLDLSGDGHGTPALDAVLVEFPRVSLRRYLPAVFGAEPASADFTDRFTAIFDTTLRSIEQRLDRLAALFDPLSAPARSKNGGTPGSPDFLSWLASWIGLALVRDWPEARRRRYVKEAARLYCLRGSPLGLHRQLLLFLGWDQRSCLAERGVSRCHSTQNCAPEPLRTPAAPPPLILEHFKLRRWLHAGRGRLGEDSVLWGQRIAGRSQLSGDQESRATAIVGQSQLNSVPDPLHDAFRVYAHRFSVFVPARVRGSEPERRALEQLLARETPAHTLCDLRYVEPRFRVGVQATIGLDSVVARTPKDVHLGANELGQGSILSSPPARRGGPKLRVGDARVGSTTVLT